MKYPYQMCITCSHCVYAPYLVLQMAQHSFNSVQEDIVTRYHDHHEEEG